MTVNICAKFHENLDCTFWGILITDRHKRTNQQTNKHVWKHLAKKTNRKKESREREKKHINSYRSSSLLFVSGVSLEKENASQKWMEADLLYKARNGNAMFAFMMNVESHDGHRRRQGDDNDRDAVVQT